jgi:hypothetical protein
MNCFLRLLLFRSLFHSNLRVNLSIDDRQAMIKVKIKYRCENFPPRP